jgi:type VI secretion system protein ImpK
MTLLDYFIPVLAYVKAQVQTSSGNVDELFKHLTQLIEDAERKAKKDGVSQQDFQDGLFPVGAWIDEQISRSKILKDAYTWQPFLLQKHFFNTTFAGVEFFQRLQDLDKSKVSIREVYVMCLSLGFLGKFSYNHQLDELIALCNSEFSSLDISNKLISSQEDPTLFPKGYELSSNKPIQGPIDWFQNISVQRIALIIIPPLLLALLVVLTNNRLQSVVKDFNAYLTK